MERIQWIDSLDNNEVVRIDQNQDSLFAFDPNTIDIEEWKLLGFSQKQAESIEAYKEKGAFFKSKEDFKKVYVVNEYMYAKLEPYINIQSTKNSSNITKDQTTKEYSDSKGEYWARLFQISEKPIYNFDSLQEIIYYQAKNNEYKYYYISHEKNRDQYNVEFNIQLNSLHGYFKSKSFKQEIKEIVIVELNTCDTAQLVQLPGIGSSFAKRIIKYRDILGGYVSTDQLLEVYGMDEERMGKFKSYLDVDKSKISQIDINKSSSKELKAHPYIEWKVANSIYNFRVQHGDYKKVEDIMNSDLIDDDLFGKLAPYLIVKLVYQRK